MKAWFWLSSVPALVAAVVVVVAERGELGNCLVVPPPAIVHGIGCSMLELLFNLDIAVLSAQYGLKYASANNSGILKV